MSEEENRICVRSDPGDLPLVRSLVERIAARAGFDEQDAGRLVLAVDEAIANVIKHGYEGRGDQPVEVSARRIEEDGTPGIALEIRDFGKQVPPEVICGRDLQDVRPGGLGVHIIRTVMDRVEYAAAEGGGMRLKMVKLKST
ncbi:MAG: ATP-binding protein [Phycisphaerae bacterium]